MRTITIWEHADARCVVLKADRGFNVQILEGLHKRREHRVDSSDEAIALANIWEASKRSAVPARPAPSRASTAEAEGSGVDAAPSPQQKPRVRAARTTAPETAQSVSVRRYPLGIARGFIY